MTDNQSQDSVERIIKNHVDGCGGKVAVSELDEDYSKAFECNIPYSKFGYKSLIEFLISIPGLTVKMNGGEYYVQKRWLRSNDSCKPAHSMSSDMSMLCVEMKNNLIVSDSAAKRKVTVKEGNSLKYPSNHALKRYNSSYPSSDYSSGSYSATSSSFDYNSSYPTGADYSFEPDEYSYAAQDYNADNYEYYSQWQQPYIPQSSYYDSSSTYQNGWADPNPIFNEQRDTFSQLLPSPNYDDFFTSPDVPDACEKLGFRAENITNNGSSHAPPVTEKQVINRLVALVNAHQKKIASSAVEFQYIDSFSDALPKNWLTLLEESKLLFIEHFTSSTIIYPTRVFSAIPTILDLPKLNLPRQMPWSVSVTATQSVDSIWFRLNENDLDRRYHILCQQMSQHYQDASPGKILSVEKHQLFVARFKQRLLRVCVIDRRDNGTCKCFAIDEGITEIFPLTSLLMLHEKFTNTPKLILQGSLVGLEKFTECSHVGEKLKTLIVSVDTSVVVEKYEAEKHSINLFVTKPDDSDSLNVNDFLLNVIKTELNLPELKINYMFDVVVLSLSVENRVAKVQIKSPCLALLQESLRRCGRIIDYTEKRLLFAKDLTDVQLNQLYLAKYLDGTWQRVLLKQYIDSSHVVVAFVDFRDIQALEVTQIICYAGFPDALTYIPPQGVTVNIVQTDHEVLKLMNHRLRTNLFSMKVVQTEPALTVQLYMRAPQETCYEDISNANLKRVCCSAV